MNDQEKELVKEIQQCAGKYSVWEVFDAFLELSALAISNSVDSTHYVERENQYLTLVKKFDHETVMAISRMLAHLIQAQKEYKDIGVYHDILGHVFHELDINDKWKGQFFTPDSVSQMMAELTLDKKQITKDILMRGYTTLNEPACGSGAMIYGLATSLAAAGFNMKSCRVVASDIDARCVYMTYLQCAIYEIPAVVVHHDSLQDPEGLAGTYFYTPAYVAACKEQEDKEEKAAATNE